MGIAHRLDQPLLNPLQKQPPISPSSPHTTNPPNQTTPQTMADKLRQQQQLEALQTRYVGTGHADTTKFEWTSNIMRDSYSSFVGHPPLLAYMSLGLGQTQEETRVMLIEKMVQPVGPPPDVED